MKLSTIRRILKEDLSRLGELPKWVDALISPLNDFLDQVSRALNGRLKFDENIQSVTKRVSLAHNVDKVISTGSVLRVIGAQIWDSDGQMVDSFGFSRNTDATLTVRAKFLDPTTGLAPTSDTACKIIILLE